MSNECGVTLDRRYREDDDSEFHGSIIELELRRAYKALKVIAETPEIDSLLNDCDPDARMIVRDTVFHIERSAYAKNCIEDLLAPKPKAWLRLFDKRDPLSVRTLGPFESLSRTKLRTGWTAIVDENGESVAHLWNAGWRDPNDNSNKCYHSYKIVRSFEAVKS